MAFHSYGFILFFLPLALIAYFGMNRFGAAAGKWTLLILSVFFISFQSPAHGLIAMLSTMVNYGFLSLLGQASSARARKSILALGIGCNVLFLCFFKYSSLPSFFPLGISFYTFQQIAFLADACQGEKTAFSDFALFYLFFPKSVQGPIPYGSELIPSFSDPNRKTFCFGDFSRGLFLFSIGLFKKVMVADKFGIFADYGYGNIASLNSFEALLTILAYTFQLYFDFSGYSDMALGIAAMFRIDLPINFNSPYKAKDISDFWKRWHITLTRFLTKYIYIPLGGNRKGTLRTFVNIMIVYLVSGIWHGTGRTFLVWGLMHGFATILYRIFKKPYDRLPEFLRWALTFLFINMTWVFFRADSISSAFALLAQVFRGGWEISVNAGLTESLLQPTFLSILIKLLSFNGMVVLSFSGALLCVTLSKNSNYHSARFKPGILTFIITYLFLIMSILSLSGVAGFLYTNF